MKTNNLSKSKMKAVLSEVRASFDKNELNGITTFDEFWDKVDVQNGYEEGWEEDKEDWKPYFAAAYTIVKS